MRLTLLLDVLAYDNTNTTNDPANALKIKKRVEESSISEVSRLFPKILADGTVDEAINLPETSNDYLIMLIDQIVSIKLNGSSDSITLKPKAAGKMTPVLLIRGDITGLLISNSSGNNANLDISAIKV